MSPDLDLEVKSKIAMEVITGKDNGSVLENPLVCKDNKNVLENSLASNDNRIVLENPSASNDNGIVLETHLASNDNGSVQDDTYNGVVLDKPLSSKDNGSVLESREYKFMRCASNHEDDTFHMEAFSGEQSRASDKSEDVEVNITEYIKSGRVELFEDDNCDATESSSSFDDSICNNENGSSLSDNEVESQFFGGNTSTLVFGGCGEAFQLRKKRLTDHWRNFIRPLMWRCRWVELRIKEFQSQASKYDRELAEYDQRKQFELEKLTLEGFCSKSLPFCSQNQGMKVMKRKKRKRVEDTIDKASYMSHHNLFSYYEKKGLLAGGASMDDDFSNPVMTTDKTSNGNDELGVNDWPILQFKDRDDSLEQTIWKVDALQAQLKMLRTRIDKVMSENPTKFSSINQLLLDPCDDAFKGSPKNLVSPPYNGDGILARSLSECNMRDLIMPESVVSSHGEVTPLHDLCGWTDQPDIVGSFENTDGMLIHNEAADEELLNFRKARIQSMVEEKQKVSGEKRACTVPCDLIPEADQTIKTSVARVQSAVKAVTSPKTNVPKKRKRGKRKAGRGKWSRRSSH